MGKKARRLTRWETADAFFSALDLEVEPELSVLRPGGGWSRLRSTEQLAAKAALAEAIDREAQQLGPSQLSAYYRAFRLRPLLKRYYAKANEEDQALRRLVLTTRTLNDTLSAFFGGDWLAFLNYIGEEPHPEEHIATALPETRLRLGLAEKATEVLGVEGVSEEQLRLIARSLYGGEISPVERRINTLKRYWETFDAIHARQRSGMEPLWGLIEESRRVILSEARDGPYREGLYRRLMPADLLEEIDALWGTAMLTRHPGRITTERFSHALMAEAFGPALRFWHGCALTAWFLCEGPYSHTTMDGLERYHERELAKLEDLGTPVDRKMFTELSAAEKRLGPEESIYGETQQTEVELGNTIEIRTPIGSRKEGFEGLRDVVTKYRRAWAKTHLDSYLKTRVEGDVREAARTYYRKMTERGGKPPTLKQFARVATGPTNRWFGGDISALYHAFSERSPVSPERTHLVFEDTVSFVRQVYTFLGGVEVGPLPLTRLEGQDQQERVEYYQKRKENFKKELLANMALDYLRLEEALGRAPTLKEFGNHRFRYCAEVAFSTDVEEAWACYESIIRDTLAHNTNEKDRYATSAAVRKRSQIRASGT